MKSFMEEKQLDSYEPEVRKAAKQLFDSIKLLRLSAQALLHVDARELPKQIIEIQKIADAAACIYASFACLLRADRALKLKLPHAHDEAVITETICDLNAAEVTTFVNYINDGPMKTFAKYHEFMTRRMLEQDSNVPVHPLTSLF